jgi:hypothetical protein
MERERIARPVPALEANIATELRRPNDAGYDTARRVFNAVIDGRGVDGPSPGYGTIASQLWTLVLRVAMWRRAPVDARPAGVAEAS